MHSFRLGALALALVATVLAGCASKGATQAPTVDGIDVAPTATTGVIRGIVVDPAIRPLEGVHLSVRSGDKVLTTTSIANGGFGFAGLAPGTYFIDAQKPGFDPVRTSADVVAGQASPPLVKVSMQPNPSTRPFVETYVFHGIIECSGTFVVVGAAVCSIPNGATCGLDPVPCSPNVTNDDTQVHYPVLKVPTWVQSELVWDSTQALGTDLSLMYSYDCGQTLLCDHRVDGSSPLLLTANAHDIKTIGIGNSTDIYVRVFNTGTGTSQGLVGATVNQDFNVYTQVFYGFTPPDGYRFSKDGEPVVPT